jgi:hypothetical protein
MEAESSTHHRIIELCNVSNNRIKFLQTGLAKLFEIVIFVSAFKISIGLSSNGRTTVFGTVYIGSNPVGPTIIRASQEGGFFVFTI